MKLKGALTVEAAVLTTLITFVIFAVIAIILLMYNKVLVKAYSSRLAWGIANEIRLNEKDGEGLKEEISERIEGVNFMLGDVDAEYDIHSNFINQSTYVDSVISSDQKGFLPIVDNWIDGFIKQKGIAKSVDMVKWKLLKDAIK